MLKIEMTYVRYPAIMGVSQYNSAVVMNLYLQGVENLQVFMLHPIQGLTPLFMIPFFSNA